MSNSMETSQENIVEAIPPLLQTIKDWNTGIHEVVHKWSKLYDEVIEVENFGEQEVAARFSSASISPAMLRWSHHIDNLEQRYHVMQDKIVAFMNRVVAFEEAIRNEEEMWKKYGSSYTEKQYKTMANHEMSISNIKWNGRKQVLEEWKASISGLIAEWNQDVKVEIQEFFQNCIFQIDYLL